MQTPPTPKEPVISDFEIAPAVTQGKKKGGSARTINEEQFKKNSTQRTLELVKEERLMIETERSKPKEGNFLVLSASQMEILLEKMPKSLQERFDKFFGSSSESDRVYSAQEIGIMAGLINGLLNTLFSMDSKVKEIGDAFARNVKNHEHIRHTDGSKLPFDYIAKLRTQFIRHGLIPPNYSPNSKEEREAYGYFLEAYTSLVGELLGVNPGADS